MFNFSDLVLEQLTLEVRYGSGYLYVDRCGSILRSLIGKWPSATAESVAVHETKVVMSDKQITLAFSDKRMSLTQPYPGSVSDIGEVGDFAIETICKALEISAFTRVGNRFIYILKVDDEEESVDLMRKTGFFGTPRDKVSKIGDTVKEPNVRFQITRDGEVGYGIRFGHVNRSLNLQLPKPITYNASKFILSGLTIDIDYFTLKPVDIGNVKAHELIKKNSREMDPLITGLFR